MNFFKFILPLALMWISGFLLGFGQTAGRYKDHVEALGYETTRNENGFWILTQECKP